MRKTAVNVKLEEFPSEVHRYVSGACVYDSSCSEDARVFYSDAGFYIKTAQKGSLQKEAELGRLFAKAGLGPQVEIYISNANDWLVTQSAAGEDATHYLDDPKALCIALAQAMRKLHGSPIEGVPVSVGMKLYDGGEHAARVQRDTFIHGDFCLPNILLENGRFTAFIDVGHAGIGDKHIDLYWVLWSLNYNLGTDHYTEFFLEQYGCENFDRAVLRAVAQVESAK